MLQPFGQLLHCQVQLKPDVRCPQHHIAARWDRASKTMWPCLQQAAAISLPQTSYRMQTSSFLLWLVSRASLPARHNQQSLSTAHPQDCSPYARAYCIHRQADAISQLMPPPGHHMDCKEAIAALKLTSYNLSFSRGNCIPS